MRAVAARFLGCAIAVLVATAPSAPRAAGTYVDVPGGAFVSVLGAQPTDVAPFSMRVEPVTNAEFAAFVASHPDWQAGRVSPLFADASYLSGLARASAGTANDPVTSVSWFAASAFCENEGARLPTWLEWEFVAAADEHRADARSDPLWRERILAWYAAPASHAPGPVGGAADYYGVRDIHGVVWEWVDDFNALLVDADSRTNGDPDKLRFCGAGALSLQDRENYAILMRIALLSSVNGNDTTSSLGFRCARSRALENP